MTIVPEEIVRAADALRDGGLVAFPTETVYGLGADATNDAAVAHIFEAKGRPTFNPLISHVADIDAAARHGIFDEHARALADAFWPGPLTLVLRKTPDCAISELALCGLETVALRCPAAPVAQELLAAVDRPVAAPSANSSGRLSPTTARHVADDLGDKVDIILDGGACEVGVESTIVDLSTDTPTLLRPGAITLARIAGIVGEVAEGTTDSDAPKAPGQLLTHYAPQTPVRLDATFVSADEALLAFGPDMPKGAATSRNLSPSGDLVEAAANLFVMLHELDAAGAAAIAVAPIPQDSLGAAINDRLKRAAAS
jgi:L-threonylcarbamoyladenylate synthase